MDVVDLALNELDQLPFGAWVTESIVEGLARASGEVVERRTRHGALASPLCGRAGLEGRVTVAVGRLSDRKHLWRTWCDVAGDLIAELAAAQVLAPGDIFSFLIICDTFKSHAPLLDTQAEAVRHKYRFGREIINMIYQVAPPRACNNFSKRTTHALLERCDPVTEKFRSSNLSSILIIALLKSILP